VDERRGTFAHDIYGARVTPGGTVLDPAGIPISPAGDQHAPRIAFDGTNYLVVWYGYVAGGAASNIYGARVTLGGTVLDPAGIEISTAFGYQLGPSVAFDGTNYLVVWYGYVAGGAASNIYGARVTLGGHGARPGRAGRCNEPKQREHSSAGARHARSHRDQIRPIGSRSSVTEPDGSSSASSTRLVHLHLHLHHLLHRRAATCRG
jgi:hypothetical protein